jgi:uncharacterized protein (UPF0332 family)
MDDKTQLLLDKSQQYLRSAAVLLEIGDYDSSVSRAYFAMFYAAQAALLRTNTSVKNRRSVRSAFVERFVEGRGRFPRRAADVLHRGYQLQETADYAHRPTVSEEDAEAFLGEAEAFIGSIDALANRRRPAQDTPAEQKTPAAQDTSSRPPSESPERQA